MLTRTTLLLGELAVRERLITPAQLLQAQEAQKR